MGELGTYKPYDYPRLCDVCGNRRRISSMVKKPGSVWVCDIHVDERTAVELDRLGANQRPYKIIPVPNPKPDSPYPDVMQAEEAVIMNFVDRMVDAGSRYESVASGMPAALSGQMISGLSWSARYLYAVITDISTPARVLVHAKALLASIAAQLLTRQAGFGLLPTATRDTVAFYGAFQELGASVYVTDDAATGGLAMLYAYRVFGTAQYLVSARAAASYLGNVQAIGRAGEHFTSSDAAGTARLNTGAVASEVSTVTGMYSNHAFYPSGLLTLEFWKALTTTDGDQSIGATSAVSGFDTSPDQLMSAAMAQMRAFWLTGVRDAAAETYTGLSATTPREFFNAYPEVKPEFPAIAGTGRWEFQDGPVATGTLVTGLNFAVALSALYAYEGYSTQVAAVDAWLRAFTADSDTDTPEGTSISELARSDTGDFDATACIPTLLLVRDPGAEYSAIAENGSSLYDWGAFGVLSPMWAAKHGATFPNARRSAFGVRQRYQDGSISDGDYVDWISLRGQSGLSYQTASAPLMNDVVRAAMFGLSLRQNPVAQVISS